MNLFEYEIRYNLIAKKYDLTEKAIAKRYSYGPTFLHLAGDLSGKRVVDVACGSGYSTRLLAKNNPALLIGIDASKEMIHLASSHDKEFPLGINYFQGKVEGFNFKKLKPIDMITALFLLHYADSKEKLLQICKSIYNALSPTGKFITITSNPDFPQMIDKQYEVTSYMPKPYKEGSFRFVKYWRNNIKLCSFLTHYWSQNTIEQKLKDAGFNNITFHLPLVSEEGLKKFGNQFWDNYFKRPHIIGITCHK